MDDRSGEEFGQRLANNVRSYCTVSPAVEGLGDVHRRLDPRGRILDLSKTHVGFAASTVLDSLIVSRLEFRSVLLSCPSAIHSDPEVLLYNRRLASLPRLRQIRSTTVPNIKRPISYSVSQST
jgi:hypothetical protein